MTSTTEPSRWIVVDDMDPSIEYNGSGWFTTNDAKESVGNFGPTYLSTLHGTNSSAELSFNFSGSAIRLWGTNNPQETSGIIDPRWECFIDGVSIGRSKHFAHPENNWVFCSWRNGVAGEHTLTVRVTTPGQTFWVDKIDYVALQGASVPSGQVVSVPFWDEAIRYGTGWMTLKDVSRFATEGGTAVEYEFEGTKLSWWGFIPSEFPRGPATATYAIDDGPLTPFTLPGLSQKQSSTYHQMFFETLPLSPGSHRLQVVHGGNDSTTPLTLECLLIQGATSVSSSGLISSPNSTSSVAPSLITNPSGSSIPGTNTIETSVPPSSNAFPPNGPPSSGPNNGAIETPGIARPMGAIAGGVLGGVAIIAIAVILLLLLHRRAHQRVSRKPQNHVQSTFGPFLPPVQYLRKGEVPSTVDSQRRLGTSGSQGVSVIG